MRNPLTKRIPKEFIHDTGKYLTIFIFMILLIGLVSGFLVTDNSFFYTYTEDFKRLKIEDGHFSFKKEAPKKVLDKLSEKADISIYEYPFFEEKLNDTEKTIRVYSDDRKVNLLNIMSGKMPSSDDEIAFDRMFADNNKIKVGDTVTLKDKKLKVTGLIASPDYSCLFQNNSDMMFDSINFSIAVMTKEAFDGFQSKHMTYNYAWLYKEFIERTDSEKAKEKSDDLMEDFKEVITNYNKDIMADYQKKIAVLQSTPEADITLESEEELKDKMVQIDSYLPRYLNQAINFTGDDMGSDKVMFLIVDYIITMVIAFVFAITTSNTIVAEAGVIGTLRASGYTKGELIAHYMVLPILVSFVAAVIGNILGYTVFTGMFKTVYYGSYSLAPFEMLWNMEAFILTTVIPIVIMFIINLYTLTSKLKLSPLRFLRHDLSKRGKKKAFRLNTKIPFIHRFRMRIIFQNIPNYLTLFFGVFVGGALMVFGMMFAPLLSEYKDLIIHDRICDYQYVLAAKQETSDEKAEKYLMTSLKTTDKRYVEDEISVFGIKENSQYIPTDIKDVSVVISNSIAEKFDLEKGDTIHLKEEYGGKKHKFKIGGIYTYNSGLAVFMSFHDYAEEFDTKKDDYTGYFSNRKLSDLDDENIAMTIDVSDLTKTSDQLTVSMGNMMNMINVVGIVIFMLLMFIMSKQIIEKNASSISMTKILGFSDGEIGKLYIVATSIVVVASLILTVPLIDLALRAAFKYYLYTEIKGYLPYVMSNMCYVKMMAAGLICYAVIAAVQMYKIGKIPKSDALKNME